MWQLRRWQPKTEISEKGTINFRKKKHGFEILKKKWVFSIDGCKWQVFRFTGCRIQRLKNFDKKMKSCNERMKKYDKRY